MGLPPLTIPPHEQRNGVSKICFSLSIYSISVANRSKIPTKNAPLLLVLLQTADRGRKCRGDGDKLIERNAMEKQPRRPKRQSVKASIPSRTAAKHFRQAGSTAMTTNSINSDKLKKTNVVETS